MAPDATDWAGVMGLPAPVRLARGLLVVVALTHLVVPVVMWLNETALADQIAAARPDLGPAEIATSAHIALAAAGVFHGVLLVLCLVPAAKLATARPWTRRLKTISQLLSVLFSVVSWSSSPMFHAVIPVIGVIQVVTVALLWAPASARGFFASGRVAVT